MTPIMVVTEEKGWNSERVHSALIEAGARSLVVQARDIEEAVRRHEPALVIATLSGHLDTDRRLCQRLARLVAAPIIAIGPAANQDHVLEMFTAGVDDYVAQPVSPQEIIARVRSKLRRVQPADCGLLAASPPVRANTSVTGAPENSDSAEPKIGVLRRFAHEVLSLHRR